MHRLFVIATLLIGCKPSHECCRTADCSGAGVSGSEVVRFRGEPPKNLMFISIDTLRHDHVGAYGLWEGSDSPTPFMDQLAGEGVVIRDHVQCANWTYGSTTCTVAGRTNIERGHLPRATGTDRQRPPVPDDTPFLATWLGQAGFKTSLVTGNKFFSKDKGNTQGYDREKLIKGSTADEVIGAAADRIRSLSKGGRHRWFMHAHVMDPHLPYKPEGRYSRTDSTIEPWPDELTGRVWPDYWDDIWPTLNTEERAQLEANTRLLYENEVRTTDARIEQAFEQLDADCMLDDVLVVFWSDHGEAFWEHGRMAHGGTLAAEENGGVLFFWAKNIEPGEWTETTSAIDVVPTVLDLMDVPIPKEVTGYPIGTAPADRPVFADAIANLSAISAVVHRDFKLQFHWKTGEMRLWDRTDDPRELVNLYAPEHPMVGELWPLLRAEVDAMDAVMIGGPDPVWPEGLDP